MYVSHPFVSTFNHVLDVRPQPDLSEENREMSRLLAELQQAVLFEAGYLSTPNEEKLMYTDDCQNREAQALVMAIKSYLKIRLTNRMDRKPDLQLLKIRLSIRERCSSCRSLPG
jgi:hypothetical protein